MRFAPIPSELARPESKVMTFGAPSGHEKSVGALEVEVRHDAEFGWCFSFLVEFDDDDLVALCKSRRMWMSQVGDGLQPVSCGPVASVLDEDGERVAGIRLYTLSDQLALAAHELVGIKPVTGGG